MGPIILVTLIHITLHTWTLTSCKDTSWINVAYLFLLHLLVLLLLLLLCCFRLFSDHDLPNVACYSESLHIHWEVHKLHPSTEWMHGHFFIVRRQKAPVLLYGMCHEVCDPRLFHTDENLTLLFNFVAVVKAHLFGAKDFLRDVSNLALILSSFSHLLCFLYVVTVWNSIYCEPFHL